ncbi:MAG: hypothetical protein V8R40_10860 [Dysosmobacter sp.]
MLVPVGHTVGIKLFPRGVLVVKLPEGGTPARECGLQTGDVIVKCGGSFRPLHGAVPAAAAGKPQRRHGPAGPAATAAKTDDAVGVAGTK